MKYLFMLLACLLFAGCQTGVFTHDVTSEKKPWTHENFPNSSEEFSFVIIPDRAGGERDGGIFPDAIKKANMFRPDFIITVGDLINGMMNRKYQTHDFIRAQQRELAQFTAKSEVPFFHVVGNHDICRTRPGFPRCNETTREVWEEFHGTHTYYSFVYKNTLFICLNNMEGADSRKPQLGMTDTQAAWAVEVLKKHPDVMWTFVFIHHPTAWDSAPWRKVIEPELIKRNYTCFAGDWHQYVKFVRHGRGHYALATAGGESKMRGIPFGEFDHITHVTVTRKGPVIANVLLDGVLPEDVVTSRTLKGKLPWDLNYPVQKKKVKGK